MLNNTPDNYSNAPAIHATYAISVMLNDGKIARIAKVQEAIPIKSSCLACDEVVSNWWEFTFEGLLPIKTLIWPPCTQSVAMALNQRAKSIVAIPSPIAEEATNE